ncbi:PREDICTED: uncharacterized protein LOC109181417 [Ipomoea nil]|uniref:uncharacterized protein LOC109181417 n=1 Tax=Ipomoea nil TaxID=35883 RepID=UPI000901D6BE|nr:PREDICTED: uncharacterized protein LOC109181417 [Ipomoea nil]
MVRFLRLMTFNCMIKQLDLVESMRRAHLRVPKKKLERHTFTSNPTIGCSPSHSNSPRAALKTLPSLITRAFTSTPPISTSYMPSLESCFFLNPMTSSLAN